MAKALQVTGGYSIFAAGNTLYYSCGNSALQWTGTEARLAVRYRTEGTFSLLHVRVNTNSVTAASTVKVRVNGADGNQAVTIPASTTGAFEDAVNTDVTSSAPDDVGYVLEAGATGVSGWLSSISTVFEASSNTVVRHVCDKASNSSLGVSHAAGTARFIAPAGFIALETNEAKARFDMNVAGTLRDFYIYVAANNIGSASTFWTRIDGVSKTLTLSVPAAFTGIVEDNANSDAVAADEDINYYGSVPFTTFFGKALQYTMLSTEFEVADNGDTGKFHSIAAGAPTTFAEQSEGYPLGGHFIHPAAEYESDLNIAANISHLYTYVSTNVMTSAGTFEMEKDGGGTALSISIGAGVTGALEDNDSEACVATNEVGYRLTAGTGPGGAVVGLTIAGVLLEWQETAAAGSILKISTIEWGSVKKVSTIAEASVSKVSTIEAN